MSHPAQIRPAVPRRRFSPDALLQLQEVITAIRCECPNQLAALVTSLQAFEDYSADCENRDEKDARVHRMLHEQTAYARELLEDALVQLCLYEGIEL